MRPLFVCLLAFAIVACEADDPADLPEVDAGAVERAVDPPSDEAASEAPNSLVNLNTATEDEFKAIPGVDDRMAHEFDEYRPYASIREFRDEIGKYVDEAQVTEYEQYVFVPVDIAAADAETLAQLPGVGPDEAAALIAARPFSSADAFLDAYVAAVPSADRDAARALLAP